MLCHSYAIWPDLGTYEFRWRSARALIFFARSTNSAALNSATQSRLQKTPAPYGYRPPSGIRFPQFGQILLRANSRRYSCSDCAILDSAVSSAFRERLLCVVQRFEQGRACVEAITRPLENSFQSSNGSLKPVGNFHVHWYHEDARHRAHLLGHISLLRRFPELTATQKSIHSVHNRQRPLTVQFDKNTRGINRYFPQPLKSQDFVTVRLAERLSGG